MQRLNSVFGMQVNKRHALQRLTVQPAFGDMCKSIKCTLQLSQHSQHSHNIITPLLCLLLKACRSILLVYLPNCMQISALQIGCTLSGLFPV